MPWITPTLTDVRTNNAAYIAGKLKLPVLPNGEVRVLADANAGNAHLALQYLDWLALQLLPDTAEKQFLDKWANIWLVNANGSRGRKVATYASGTVAVTGIAGTVLPAGALLMGGAVAYQTTQAVTIGAVATAVPVRALDAGAAGNLAAGGALSLSSAIAGITAGATAVSLTGGTDEEDDDDLRERVLERIRLPPMGGDADDYVAWALRVAGVTRAWCSPLEMGMGTVTVRFMCDELRATNDPRTSGLPNAQDLAAMRAYLDTVRPVAVKDIFIVAPVLQAVSFRVTNLVGDSIALRAAIAANVKAMLRRRAAPAHALNGVPQPATDIPAAWVSEAIYAATSGVSFDLLMGDAVMATPGCMATLGTIGA